VIIYNKHQDNPNEFDISLFTLSQISIQQTFSAIVISHTKCDKNVGL